MIVSALALLAVSVDAAAYQTCEAVVPRPDLLPGMERADLASLDGDTLACPLFAYASGPNGMRLEIVEYTFSEGAWLYRRSYAADGPVDQGRASALRRWTLSRDRDPITGTTNYHARVRSKDAIYMEFSRQIDPNLVLACYADNTQVYVNFPETYIGRDTLTVTYRLDGQPARTENWAIGSSGRNVGAFSGRRAIPLVRQLSEADQLVVRLTAFSQPQWTITFDLEGIESVVSDVREACGW